MEARHDLPGSDGYAAATTMVNRRFTGTPAEVITVSDTQQVLAAVAGAVRAKRRLGVRSGGHCYEGFAADPSVDLLLDVSGIDGVAWDPARAAFEVGAGARLGGVYRALLKGWGVTLPGGSCHSVGVGGHLTGGGYGVLSRRHGLTIDHMAAVEVVVVDAAGMARTVVATRDPADPHDGLYWACTGGGGGGFGVVTRFWLGSPRSDAEPGGALPRPPERVWLQAVGWPWDRLDRAGFDRLLTNFAAWHERNSAPGDGYSGLAAALLVPTTGGAGVSLRITMDATVPDSADRLRDFVAAVGDGVDTPSAMPGGSPEAAALPRAAEPRPLPWAWASQLTGGSSTGLRAKYKSAFLRRRFTAGQLDALWHALTRPDYRHPDALLQIDSFGGAVNAVAPHATAFPHRDSVLKVQWQAYWESAAHDARHLAWIREAYRDTFLAGGGVPAPDDQVDGCYVNYADADLCDPAWNASGRSCGELYFGANYPRLRAVKGRWDPLDMFRHPQSVPLP